MLCLLSIIDFLAGHLPTHGIYSVPAAPTGGVIRLLLFFGQVVHGNIMFHMIAPFQQSILPDVPDAVKRQKGPGKPGSLGAAISPPYCPLHYLQHCSQRCSGCQNPHQCCPLHSRRPVPPALPVQPAPLRSAGSPSPRWALQRLHPR